MCVFSAHRAYAAHSAPDWVHAAAQKFQPHYDEKTDAVLLYSETDLTVISKDKIRTHVREVYKILRPEGRRYGEFFVYTSGRNKITFMRGWCVPEHGQDYEVTDKDAIEQSELAIPGYSLATDTRRKFLRIPAPDPGNVVGYEYEVEEQPFYLQDVWDFQNADPVLESHYRLTLPEGWQFKASWIKHSEIVPTKKDGNTWEWTVADVPGIRYEQQMPPYSGVASKMVISFLSPGGAQEYDEFTTWNDMGRWYDGLIGERDAATAPIKEKVSSVTLGDPNTLTKMRDIAKVVQNEVRYVAIELGIGGWQPHAASDVFSNRYGDCKDKATLIIAMMHAIGVEAYYVIINATRGAVNGDDPAHNGFNHAITAIRLPADMQDSSLVATIDHPKLGRLLFFDPTDEVTPFGQIRGALQANYGLLVGPEGGELVQLPTQAPALTGTIRLARLVLDNDGTLRGEVNESRLGERALQERQSFREAASESDKVKLFEALLSDSLSSFQITHASFSNLADRDKPFGLNYAFRADAYAKNAGDMLLVRPRVLGVEGSGLLETDEPRILPIEFHSPVRDYDTFEISLQPGFEVVDMPAPVDADFGFGNYHSKVEFNGNVLRYTRTFEMRDLMVPASKAAELKRFYRIIATDERSTVVLKRNLKAQGETAVR